MRTDILAFSRQERVPSGSRRIPWVRTEAEEILLRIFFGGEDDKKVTCPVKNWEDLISIIRLLVVITKSEDLRERYWEWLLKALEWLEPAMHEEEADFHPDPDTPTYTFSFVEEEKEARHLLAEAKKASTPEQKKKLIEEMSRSFLP
jgi:hypothetical protein